MTALQRPKELKDSIRNVPPADPGYHYEELYHNSMGRYGIWDVPGNEAYVRMWPMFYRYVNITAVIFVVDVKPDYVTTPEGENRIAKARRLMRFLLNEDELRVAAFVLILNTVSKDEKAVQNVRTLAPKGAATGS